MSAPAAGEYLTFEVAGEEYGIPILRVREILRYEPLTRVPGMPSCVRGVCNLRGLVVPVVDLALKLQKLGEAPRESPVTRWTCFVMAEVMLEGERTLMGVLADAVKQVLPLGAADIAPAPTFGTRVRAEHVLGMGRLEQRFVILLDVDRLLSIDELVAAAPPRPAETAEAPTRDRPP